MPRRSPKRHRTNWPLKPLSSNWRRWPRQHSSFLPVALHSPTHKKWPLRPTSHAWRSSRRTCLLSRRSGLDT
eukprot:3008940-Amphidinium_carterae.1